MSVRLLASLLLGASQAARPFGGLYLPPVLYAAEGWEGNVYFDNVSPSRGTDFVWEVSIARDPHVNKTHDMGQPIAGTARQQDERLTYAPKGGFAPTDVTFQVLDRDSAGEPTVLAKATSLLVCANRSAAAGKTARLLVIGDSLTASGEHTAALLDIAAAERRRLNSSLLLTLLGTRGQSLTNRHEGRGGWTVQDYATVGREGGHFTVHGVRVPPAGDPRTSAPEELYQIVGPDGAQIAAFAVWDVRPAGANGSYTLGASCYPCPKPGTAVPSSGVLRRVRGDSPKGDALIAYSSYAPGSINPFWHGGKLDVAAYLATNRLPTPTAATIMLGDNDLSGTSTDAATDAKIATMVPQLKALVGSLLDAGVGDVGVVMQPPPSHSQDGCGADYGTGIHKYRVKRSMLRWWKAQAALVGALRNVQLVPAGLNLALQGHGRPPAARDRLVGRARRALRRGHPRADRAAAARPAPGARVGRARRLAGRWASGRAWSTVDGAGSEQRLVGWCWACACVGRGEHLGLGSG